MNILKLRVLESFQYGRIPCSVMKETMHKTENLKTDIMYTKLSHKNSSLRKDSEERSKLKERGFEVTEKRREIEL